jgi:hypothetical protein
LTDEWRARITAKFGHPPQVDVYDSPVQVDRDDT